MAFCRWHGVSQEYTHTHTHTRALIHEFGKGAEYKISMQISVVLAINATTCIYLWQREVYTQTLGREGNVKTEQRYVAMSQGMPKVLEGGKGKEKIVSCSLYPTNTSTVDFCPLELWGRNFCCYKPLSLWQFVMAALRNEYNYPYTTLIPFYLLCEFPIPYGVSNYLANVLKEKQSGEFTKERERVRNQTLLSCHTCTQLCSYFYINDSQCLEDAKNL